MKTKIPQTIGIILIVLGLFFILTSLIFYYSLLLYSFLFGILLISLGVILLFEMNRIEKEFLINKDEEMKVQNPNETLQTSIPKQHTKNKKSLKCILHNNILSYSYSENLCFNETEYDEIIDYLNQDIIFKQEPENPYDKNAVSVNLKSNGKKIGYVYKGKIQEMLNDWLNKGLYVDGFLSNAREKDFDKHIIEYKIGFYKDIKQCTSRSFPLTHISKKDYCDIPRYENLSYCSVGDQLLFEYNAENDIYTLTDTYCNEVGDLPKSANNYMKSENKKIIIINELDYDDNNRLVASVNIFAI